MGAADAVALKDEGNKAFKEHDWLRAIECYSKAIEVKDDEPTFYTNRAQVPPRPPPHHGSPPVQC